MSGMGGSQLPPAAWSEHFAPDGTPYYHNSATGESVWERPRELGPPAPAPPVYSGPPMPHGGYAPQGGGYGYEGPRPGPVYGGGGYGGTGGGYGYGAGPAGPYSGGAYGMGPTYGGGPGPGFANPGPPIQRGRNASGPPGSNLFIFHIPNDMTNKDLFTLFLPFGNVISARIMVERETGRSRGFGFVSFDNPVPADAAARAMDGHQVGRKRLKVTLKKERDMPGGGEGGGDYSYEAGGGAAPMSMNPGPPYGVYNGGGMPHGMMMAPAGAASMSATMSASMSGTSVSLDRDIAAPAGLGGPAGPVYPAPAASAPMSVPGVIRQ